MIPTVFNKSQIVYLAGPCSGEDIEEMASYYEQAQYFTKELIKKGFVVISPILNSWVDSPEDYLDNNIELEWQHYLCHDINLISKISPDICAVMPGWEKSKGACVEVAIFRNFLGITEIPVEELLEDSPCEDIINRPRP